MEKVALTSTSKIRQKISTQIWALLISPPTNKNEKNFYSEDISPTRHRTKLTLFLVVFIVIATVSAITIFDRLRPNLGEPEQARLVLYRLSEPQINLSLNLMLTLKDHFAMNVL